MSDTSEVQILYDDIEITASCVITSAKFTVNSSAEPGTCEITLVNTALDFVTGKRLKLLLDGQAMWSGFTTMIGRGDFFPAGDGLGTEDTLSRRWVLRGVDNNILLDKRVLRYPTNYLSGIPLVTTDEYDGATLRRALSDYADMPSWLDITTQIDDVALLSEETGMAIVPVLDTSVPEGPWSYPQQGSKLRSAFEALAQLSGAVYYLGPDDAAHYHALQDQESPWGFSDQPNNATISGSGGFEGAYYGFRELNASEDGSGIVTDALVWGGSEFAGSGQTVFARATDDDLELNHNKWQMAEEHFGQRNFKTQPTVTQRANMIVYGNPDGDPGGSEPGTVPGEGPRGLRFPQWSYAFSWHTRNVPTIAGTPRHIYPGELVSIQLWAFSEDAGVTPFSKFLPLRSLAISFPSGAANGEAMVRFDGTFDLRNQDSKFLWAYLRGREEDVRDTQLAVIDDTSVSAPYGGVGQFVPTPATDGVETVFYVPFGYIPDSAAVYLNGLLQRVGTDYTESDPDNGEFTFTTAPLSTDSLYITTRTLAG